MTSHERRGVSYHMKLDSLFNSITQSYRKTKIKTPYHWPFVCVGGGIHRWHKGSIIRKTFQYYDVIINKRTTITWCRHQMETFSALLAICAGNSPVTGEFPSPKNSDSELWCFLSSAPEWTIEQTIVRVVIWDAIEPIVTRCTEFSVHCDKHRLAKTWLQIRCGYRCISFKQHTRHFQCRCHY